MSGCLKLLPKIKGKVRDRVLWLSVRTSQNFVCEKGLHGRMSGYHKLLRETKGKVGVPWENVRMPQTLA